MTLKKLSFIFSLLLFSILCFAKPTENSQARLTQVTAGPYFKQDSIHTLAMLLVSNDNGKSWSFIQNIFKLPLDTLDREVSALTCKGNICVGAGSFATGEKGTMPLLLVSQNRGNAWSFVQDISDISSLTLSGKLHAITATNTSFIAAGEMTNLSDHANPALILLSQNNGRSWSRVRKIDGLPSGMSQGSIQALTCTSTLCVAAGNYNVNENQLPLVLTSLNNGVSWSVIQNFFNLPIGEKHSRFTIKGLSCGGLSCTAVGFYEHKETILPLLINSNNQGKSWSFVQAISGLPLGLQSGNLNAITCTRLGCIAVGDFKNDSDVELPLLIITHGAYWGSVQNIVNLPSIKSGSLTAVACDDNICTAVGSYKDGNEITHPLLLLSTNTGQSWNFVQGIANLPTSSFRFSGALKNVTCSDHQCTAVGTYHNYNGRYYKYTPLVLVSKDSGRNWSFVQSIFGLPSNLSFGELNAITTVNEATLSQPN